MSREAACRMAPELSEGTRFWRTRRRTTITSPRQIRVGLGRSGGRLAFEPFSLWRFVSLSSARTGSLDLRYPIAESEASAPPYPAGVLTFLWDTQSGKHLTLPDCVDGQ